MQLALPFLILQFIIALNFSSRALILGEKISEKRRIRGEKEAELGGNE